MTMIDKTSPSLVNSLKVLPMRSRDVLFENKTKNGSSIITIMFLNLQLKFFLLIKILDTMTENYFCYCKMHY